MMATPRMEYIITPETTYIAAGSKRAAAHLHRWPSVADPTPSRPMTALAIGHWIDEDGDGVYDVLEVDTRGPFKGPRSYDATGLPLHFDNQSVFKERFHLDKNDPEPSCTTKSLRPSTTR